MIITTFWAWALLAHPQFTEVAPATGIDHVQHVARQSPDCLFGNGTFCEPERMTGGVAVGDYDGDGRDDLYFTVLDGRDRLYRNLGRGAFEEALPGFAGDGATNGATWVDVDRDGDLDLYLTSLATHRYALWINDGGRFTEEAAERGAALPSPQPHFGWSIAAGDYDRDGWVDLVVGEWFAAFVILGEEVLLSHVAVLRNRGAEAPGHFELAHDADDLGLWALSNDGVWAFSPSLDDLDGDGWPDLLLASDFNTSRLYWNDAEGGFVDGTVAAGVGTDENGMGSTVADFDGDGRLDWFVTSIWDPANTCDMDRCGWEHDGNRLYRNLGNRRFEDATDALGVRRGFWGWGAVFFDPDNDGDLDLVMTNGVDFPGARQDAPFHDDPMRFWENDRGDMVEKSRAVGLLDTGSGKGVATLDYDQDGDLDLVITRNATTPLLYRNDSENENAWFRLRAVGGASNLEGLGARVRVQPSRGGPEQLRVVGAQSYFLGQSERVAHFGLGPDVDLVDVRVWWPTGVEETARCLPVRQTLRWLEGQPPPDGECPAPPPDAGTDAGLPDAAARDVDAVHIAPDAAADAGPDAVLPDAQRIDVDAVHIAPDAALPDVDAVHIAPDAALPDAQHIDVDAVHIAPDAAPLDVDAVHIAPDAAPLDVDAVHIDPDATSDSAADATDFANVDVVDIAPDAAEAEVSADEGCGCRSSGGALWVGLLLLGWRRRGMSGADRPG